ncbi:unnamed protein product [Cochlearia groenlandica]
MEKAALIFICLVLFSTCTQIQALYCEKVSDCVHFKCITKVKCQENKCTCVDDKHIGFLPLDNCGVAASACSDYCKAKGEVAYACIYNHCFCRKPPM